MVSRNDRTRLPAYPDAQVEQPSRRIIRKTASELVTDELRNRILLGQMLPGDPLRQELLAEELGVSRLPIREAIRTLSSEGLVDLFPHRGAYVSTLSRDEVQELFDIRLRMEPWLLQLAVGAFNDAALARAETLIRKMDQAGPDQWGKLNWELHETLYAPALRPAALSMVRALHEKSERYFRFQVVNAPIRKEAHDEHMQLVELCRAGQAVEAAQAMEAHITRAAVQIIAIVDQLLADSADSR